MYAYYLWDETVTDNHSKVFTKQKMYMFLPYLKREQKLAMLV